MSIDIMTKEDLMSVVYDINFNFDDFIALISQHFDIKIDESYRDINKREALVNLVYKAYSDLLKEVEIEKHKKIVFGEKEDIKGETKDQDIFNVKSRWKNKKTHIIELCKDNRYRKKDIIKILDDSWDDYKDGKKTSKSLVYSTITKLHKANLVIVNSDKIIRWRV